MNSGGSTVARFDVFPAIDLLDGQSVRLERGERATAHVVHPDPVAQILGYAAAGARWVHIVNLNAAFGDTSEHSGAVASAAVINQLVAATKDRGLDLQLQVGGGVRSRERVLELFGSGVARVVIGTWALKDPDAVCDLARQHGERIVVGLDTRGDQLTSEGWTQSESGVDVVSFGRRLARSGVHFALYTRIENDGMLTGADLVGVRRLASATGLRILASGGVAGLDDIRLLAEAAAQGVAGVIVGKALHAQRLKLEDALAFQSKSMS